MIFNNSLLNNIMYTAIVVVSIYILYIIYSKIRRYTLNTPLFVRKPVNAKKPLMFESKNIPEMQEDTYTIMFWMNVNDWDYRKGEWKHVLNRGNQEANMLQPGIWLHPDRNDLIVRFDIHKNIPKYEQNVNRLYGSFMTNKRKNYKKVEGKTIRELKEMCELNKNCDGFMVFTQRDIPYTDNTVIESAFIKEVKEINDRLVTVDLRNDNIGKYATFIKSGNLELNPTSIDAVRDDSYLSNNIENIPLNRWTHIALVVSDQSVDIYVDGRLKQSKTLLAPIKVNKGNLYVTQGGGFGGGLTQLRYMNYPISFPELKNIVSWGPDPWTLPDIGAWIMRIIPKIQIDVSVKTDYEISSS